MNEKKNITTKETFDLAVQNHQKNNLEVAENLYKKILEKDPNHFQSICFLGTLSIQIKNFERAKKLLNKAIGIQPNNANVNNNLGIVNNELEDFQKAKYNLARTNIRNYNH
jgi:Tfp pilus assembly protein PilF